jgi:hypothetical protein
MFPGFRPNCQVIEKIIVNRNDERKKRGTPKNEGISLDVVENKDRKNVSSCLCVDVIEK